MGETGSIRLLAKGSSKFFDPAHQLQVNCEIDTVVAAGNRHRDAKAVERSGVAATARTVASSTAAVGDGVSNAADATQVLAGAKGVDDMPAFGSRAGDAFKAYKVTKLAGKVGKVGDVAEIGGKAIMGDVKGAAAAGLNTLSGVAAGAGAGLIPMH